MHILFCSGEVYPFSKSGGLADIVAALPKALAKLGHQVKIITPFYQEVQSHDASFKPLGQATITMGPHKEEASFFETSYEGIDYVFVGHEQFFNRERLYGYDDDHLRFTFFNFAIFEYILLTADYPEILHLFDWQTGMMPFFLDTKYRAKHPKFKSMKTLLSIHNLEKQGSFPLETEKLFGNKNFTYIHMDRVNFLKCGIMRAHAINTVSENYRDEILTHFYGFSLDGPLKARQMDLYGILNGLDQDLYNPMTNPFVRYHYDETSFKEGKKANKMDVLNTLKLNPDPSKPMIAFINRFARQKGVDLLMPALETFLKKGAFTFVALGYGEALYESFFERLAHRYPELVYVEKTFELSLTQKVYAASDLFLLPSLYEPCGLNHMIAMRYGALPLVRETGGLKDTVTPLNKNTGIGVGFAFKNYDTEELMETMNQALTLYHEDEKTWDHLIWQAMHVNHSLPKMAKQYEALYQKIK